MASNTTNTIQQTLNWIFAYLVGRPTTGVGGFANEPGLTSANYIMQTILAPPFRWEWNRTTVIKAFQTVVGQSDYKVSLPTYGWLEKATLIDPNPSPNTPPNFELEIYSVITKEGKPNRPAKIAVLLDDNNGNITFRLFPRPDKIYTIDFDFQAAPILATTLGTTTWAPIPDKMAFLYEQGLKAQMQGMYNIQLYLAGTQLFFQQLVGAAEGLTEMEKAIFLEDSLRILKTRTAEMATIQQSKQGR